MTELLTLEHLLRRDRLIVVVGVGAGSFSRAQLDHDPMRVLAIGDPEDNRSRMIGPQSLGDFAGPEKSP